MKTVNGRRKVWVIIIGALFIAAALVVAVTFAINRAMVSGSEAAMYAWDDEEIPHRKVALVLGARVYKSGRLSAVLEDRVKAAISLYQRGIVEKLLMSGDNRTEHYNEVTAMRNYAISKGVPSDDVLRDFAGFRTYDSVYRAKMLWDLTDMVIVSQKFHLPRALYIARRLEIDAVGVEAPDVQYSGMPFWQRREMAARVVAWFDVLIGRDPYFLGEKESLSGDAQKTRIPED